MVLYHRPPSWSRPKERWHAPLVKVIVAILAFFALQASSSDVSPLFDLDGGENRAGEEEGASRDIVAPVFHPEKSRTFTRRADGEFSVSYLDGSTVEGLIGRDVVQVGGFFAPADFIYVMAGSGLKQRELSANHGREEGQGGQGEHESTRFDYRRLHRLSRKTARKPSTGVSVLGLGFPNLQKPTTSWPKPLLYSFADTAQEKIEREGERMQNDRTGPFEQQPRPGNHSKSTEESLLLKKKQFALLLDESGGEIQLGGFDPEAVDPSAPLITYSNVIPECVNAEDGPASDDDSTGDSDSSSEEQKCGYTSFRVEVESLRVGQDVIFGPGNARMSGSRVALIDSGTTCLVFPTTSGAGAEPTNVTAQDGNVFAAFSNLTSRASVHVTRPSIFIRINKTEFEIPYELYARGGQKPNSTTAETTSTPPPTTVTSTSKPSTTPRSEGGGGEHAGGVEKRDLCALSLKSAPSLFLLGNVFLRTVVAIHDLESEPARMGFARRNPAYVPRGRRRRRLGGEEKKGEKVGAFASMPLYARRGRHRMLEETLTDPGWDNATRIKVEELEGIEYMTYISVGTPRQDYIPAILDTGSSALVLLTTLERRPFIPAFVRGTQYFFVAVAGTSVLVVMGVFALRAFSIAAGGNGAVVWDEEGSHESDEYDGEDEKVDRDSI